MSYKYWPAYKSSIICSFRSNNECVIVLINLLLRLHCVRYLECLMKYSTCATIKTKYLVNRGIYEALCYEDFWIFSYGYILLSTLETLFKEQFISRVA